MRSLLVPATLAVIGFGTANNVFNSASAVTIDWVSVGNAGNLADPTNAGSIAGIGAVPYTYSISKYEVTNSQWVEFLNAVDPNGTNTKTLYSQTASFDGNVAGVTMNSAAASGSKYSVIAGQGNKPVTYVNFYDIARMANWMHNGQGSGSTETGVYEFTGLFSVNGGRSAGATVVVPTESEWYKAAYHQPVDQGGDADGYWAYATGSNTVISGDVPAGGVNSGNIRGTKGYAVTQNSSYNDSQNYLTNVGSYTLADSYYGTFDQGGNVMEWTETLGTNFGNVIRASRGGSWMDGAGVTASNFRGNSRPTDRFSSVGFRLAMLSVPEPTAITGVACAAIMTMRRRSRKSA